MFSLNRLAALALLACALAPGAYAQGATGQITGTVSDQQGGRVAGASVIVTSLDTGAARQVETDGDGNFAVLLLPAGRYKIEVSAQGFGRILVESATVNVTQTTTLNDLMLAPTLQGKTVTVTDQGQGSLVRRKAAQVGRVITGRDAQATAPPDAQLPAASDALARHLGERLKQHGVGARRRHHLRQRPANDLEQRPHQRH